MCDPPPVSEARDPARSRRVIRVIAAERFVRGVLLLAAGAYLVTHLGSDLGRLAEELEKVRGERRG